MNKKVSKKHILFVLDYYHPHLWGAENVFMHIIEGLLAKWFHISVLTCKHDPKLPDVEKLDNLTIYRTWTNRINLMRFALLEWYRLLKQNHFDLIYTTTYTSALPARILWFLFQKQTIITVHEIFGKLRYKYKPKLKWFVSFLFEKFLMSLNFSIYHTVSWYSYNSLRINYWISDQKLKMIYNGVDHDFRNPKNVDTRIVNQMKKMYGMDWKFVIMYMWHTWKSKWLDYFIDAIPKIIKKYPDTVFILNLIQADRDIEVKTKLSKLKRKHKILKKQLIQFDGTLLKKDLLHRVACSDCVIVPSISDGFGLVAAEVSSFGKPLIVSWCSALPEVVSGVIRWIKPWSVWSILKAFEDIKFYLQENNDIWWKDNHKTANKNIKIYEKKNFSWSESIDKIENMINNLLN